MRIQQVSVKQLFDMFDHTIQLNLDDHITIIHGPNGLGKTTMLRMMDALFNARYSRLRAIPFALFRVEFDNNHGYLQVERTSSESDEPSGRSRKVLKFEYAVPNKVKQNHTLRSIRDSVERFPLSLIEREIPNVSRIGSDEWVYLPTGEILDLEELVYRYGDTLNPRLSKARELPEWLTELQESIHISLVESQRLLSPTYGRAHSSDPLNRVSYHVTSERSLLAPAVTKYADELALAIRSTLEESAALSQSLDRTFPARAVRASTPRGLTSDELRKRLADLEQKRSDLRTSGLLDKDEEEFQVPENLDERTRAFLSVYIEDVERKLSVFNEMASKISLFSKLVARRFRYKTMAIGKEKGFAFTTVRGGSLSPTDLSSGEQHELVLLYELIFKVRPNSLFLIDEPELSLHVAWQEQFLRDLQDVTELGGFDVLIATHSPQIISDRWDLTVELKGPQ